MDSRRRFLLKSVVIFAVVLTPVFLYYYSLNDRSDPTENTDSELEHYIEDFRLVENPTADETWILSSPRAEREGMKIQLLDPRLVYKTGGDTRARASASRGRYHEIDDILELVVDVNVYREEPAQHLETDSLTWRRREGILETESDIKFTDARGVFEATGLYWDISAERMEFKSDIRLRWH